MQKKICINFVSFNMISWSLFGRKPTEYKQKCIKKGFKELVDREYIVLIDNYSKSEFVVDLTALYFKQGSEYFVVVTDNEMHKIMNLECEGTSNFSLFRFYMGLVGSFNWSTDLPEEYRGKICGLSYDALSTVTNYSKKTVIEYISILEQNQIIFVYRHDDIIKYDDGTIKQFPNAYARYEDKNICIQFKKYDSGYFESIHGHVSSDTNIRRGLAQKYLAFCNGKEYSIETLEEIYTYCQEWNKNKVTEYKAKLNDGELDVKLQQKDLSVFDAYLDQIQIIQMRKAG